MTKKDRAEKIQKMEDALIKNIEEGYLGESLFDTVKALAILDALRRDTEMEMIAEVTELRRSTEPLPKE